jgi:hypothetical protein
MWRLFAAAVLIVVMGASTAREYAVGQVWTYHVRPGDESSTLQINKIDQDPTLGAIFHISVFGVHISGSRSTGNIASELPHLPVSKQTLDASVEALSSNPYRQVAYEQGYSIWRQAFDSGHGGVYTITIAEIISTVEKAIARVGSDAHDL